MNDRSATAADQTGTALVPMPPKPLPLRLWRGEVELGRLWLEPERVRWCDAAGRCREAALSAALAQELIDRLPR